MHFPAFLRDNILTLRRTGSPAGSWTALEEVDCDSLRDNLFTNSFGLLDFNGDDGPYFESQHPNTLYSQWPSGPDTNKDASLILGCNLGFGLNHLLINTPQTHAVVVLEPDPKKAVLCLGLNDYRHHIVSGKLQFISPDIAALQKVLKTLTLHYLFGNIYFLHDPVSLSKLYDKWSENISKALNHFRIETDTVRNWQDTYVENELQNLTHAKHEGTILPFINDGLRDIPAVVFGAGPSLQKNAPYFSNHQDSYLMTTAFQTLPALLRLGIRPHICMALDAHPAMMSVYESLSKDDLEDIILLYSTKSYPELSSQWPGKRIPLWTHGGLFHFHENTVKHLFNAGGNVGVALIRFLMNSGVQGIITVGQDFGSKGNRTHAEGHHRSTISASEAKSFNIRIQNENNETIVTSQQLINAKHEMEIDISSNSTISVFNILDHGLTLQGAENGIFNEAVRTIKPYTSSIKAKLQSIPYDINTMQIDIDKEYKETEYQVQYLEKLFKKPNKHGKKINKRLESFLGELTQITIMLPYYINDIQDLSYYTKFSTTYDKNDWIEIQTIIAKLQEKIMHFKKYFK